jgi:hypothetical protein
VARNLLVLPGAVAPGAAARLCIAQYQNNRHLRPLDCIQ